MDSRPLDLLHLLPTCIDVNLYSDMSYQQAACVSLRNSFLKKLEPPGDNLAANKAALDLFLENNEKASSWAPDKTSYYYDIAIRAREILKTAIYSGVDQRPIISISNALERVLPGPGSSLGTKATDFYRKVFNSEMTTYSGVLYKYYSSTVSTSWKMAEINRRNQFGVPYVVDASRLTFAKKNSEISRVINTEASLDMMFQKGISSCIEEVLLRSFNIDLTKQPQINRHLARLGSVDGSNATIDLKSSSDLNRYKFCEWFFPPQIFKTLDMVRSKLIELPREYGGGKIPLHMMSTMGNGYTFSLQTLIFVSLLKAVYEESGLPTDCSEYPHYSVFGDDIICVSDVYHKVIKLLEFCGFVVNDGKSFNTGAFRESCGQDFFKGHNIRGIYLKRLDHETHYFSIFNRLTRWSINNGVDASRVLRHIFRNAKSDLRVPLDMSDISGFKFPLEMTPARKVGPASFKFHAVTKRTHAYTKADSHRYDDEIGRPENPDGFMQAVLGGYVDGGCKSYVSLLKRPSKAPHTVLRSLSERPITSVKRGITSSWDFIPHRGLTIPDYLLALADI